jgi:hypothetical protein
MSYGNITNSLQQVYDNDLASHFTPNILNHPQFIELLKFQYYLMLSGTFILEKYIQTPRVAI